MKKTIQLIVLGLALSCTVLAQAAKPVFLITPVTKAPSTIYAGQTVTTTYKVTNNTPYALDGNGVSGLPAGVTQAGGSCNVSFNLASGASCTLTLQIVADKLRGDVRGGPKVCNTLSHPIYCSIPSLGNELNMTKSNNPPPVTLFTIGGTISGLTASGLVLRNNGADDLTVPSGATSFEFATPVAYGDGYNVTVATQPAGLTCTISNGMGTNVTANINNVSITCNATTFTIGGSITGLNAAGLVLRNNNDTATDISITSGATDFEFAIPVAYGGGYAVTVATQPTGLICTVNNGTGTNVTADVTNVQVDCYTVGDAFGGGVIYRIDGSTAYILSLADVATSVTWGPFTDVTTSASNTFDTSTDNTYTLLEGPSFPAAEACRSYSAGSGAGTWFLPAQDEWPLIVANITTINANSGVSGFTQFTTNSEYWSSSQYGHLNAFTRLFTGPASSDEIIDLKSFLLRVRCVRALTI
ncbi:hypothetical protein [uncultured Legionella sp.]|uniref:hypothetical protein n=1 Tax=uncultured Legionella sp. TaxID=210934 RepID=UPI0026329548|nr:hypothetical protein [uncultured Legionella sp.]